MNDATASVIIVVGCLLCMVFVVWLVIRKLGGDIIEPNMTPSKRNYSYTALPVQPGQRYVLKVNTDGDPFPGKLYKPVVVLDVRDGWVRYKIGDLYDDERCESSVFLAIYERVF